MTKCEVCGGTIPEQNPNGCGTPNYHLPQWRENDVTSWLVQMNYAMMAIDLALHGLALRTSIDGLPTEALESIEKLEKDMAAAQTTLFELVTTVTSLNQTVANQQTQLATIATQITTLTTNYVNCDTRLSTMEAALEGVKTSVEKVTENLNSLTDRVQALEDK